LSALDREAIEALIALASDGSSEAAVRAGEEAARAADALNDEPLGYEARMALIRAATFEGYAERGVVAFAWCRALKKRRPDLVDDRELLWRYKWVVNAMIAMPGVSRERLRAVLDDFEAAIVEFGAGRKAVLGVRLSAAQRLGDMDQVAPLTEAWQAARRDTLADCAACEQNALVELLALLRQDASAVTAAQPILDGGMSCHDVPGATYSVLLGPLLRLGRAEEAEALHRKGYRLVERSRALLKPISEHLEYLVATGKVARAVALFEQHVDKTAGNVQQNDCFLFWVAGARLFSAAAEAHGDGPIRLKGRREPMTAAALREECRSEAAAIAARFDARNGNDFYGGLLRAAMEPAVKEPTPSGRSTPQGA
jgi:hypothetical protein